MAYRRYMASVLFPTSFMATDRDTPARSRFPTAVRLKSWGSLPTSPARGQAFAQAFRKLLIGRPHGLHLSCIGYRPKHAPIVYALSLKGY